MIIKIVLIIFGLLVFWQIIVRVLARLFPFPAPAFIGHFLSSNLRRKLQPPKQLIQRAGIKPGMKVLDLGCGSGAFTFFIAKTVGKNGKVHALDIQPKMLKQLEKKLAQAENKEIKNIEVKLASADQLPFANNFFDLVNLVTVLPEIPNKPKALQEIKRVLKTGGVLAVTELLPDPHYPCKSTTIKLATDAGFMVKESFGNFFNYTVRFQKP